MLWGMPMDCCPALLASFARGQSTAGVLPAGEGGRRAGGTIELADSQRPLTLPRARAPLSRGGGGWPRSQPQSQARLKGVCGYIP